MNNNVPDYIKQAFETQKFENKKISTSGFIYAIHTDMTSEGDFADVYAAVDSENLYILYGEELVTKTDGPRRIVAQYRADKLEIFPISKLANLRTERLLSTGRLILGNPFDEKEEDGENPTKEPKEPHIKEDERLLLLYTLGYLGFVERLIKVIKNIRKGEEPLKDVVLTDSLFCDKCGGRYPEPDRKLCPKCMDKKGLTLRLLSFFKYYKAKVALILLTILVSTGLAIVSPIIGTQLFLDEVLTVGGQYYGAVTFMIGLLFLVRVVNTAVNILSGYVLAKVIPWLIYDLKLRIFEAMQQLSVSFYTSKRTGNLMNRVNRDANNIYWFFVDGVPFLIVNILLFVGVIAFMFVLDWRLATIAVSVIPLCMFLFRLLFRLFRGFHHKDWVYSSQMNSMVSDSVNGQRVIKAFAREEEETSRFSVAGGRQASVETKMFNLGFTAFPLIYMLMFLGQVVVLGVGGMMVINGEMTLGVLMTFIAYLSMLYGPLEFLSWVSNWWARCLDSSQRVFEIIDSKPDVVDPENPVNLPNLKGDITVQDVWFEYDPATPILKGLNLTVPAGTTLGIVGKTGAGKSTLANLIARLYDVKEGTITVDNVNVKNLSLLQLRRSIGIVSQDIYLFIGSIAENIRYARPEATTEEIIWAAKMASAHEFIMNLPDGYETRVGAGGQELSGGERQRLSIARTIIQNPKILILDEATAAMDTETEGKIQAALNQLQKDRTTIAIAHRLSTLKDANSLAVIQDGKVIESGTHEELMKLKKEYHKLFMIQMEGLKVISMD